MIDLSGGECNVRIPEIGSGFCGLSESALEYVQGTLVLCDVYRADDQFIQGGSVLKKWCDHRDANKLTNFLIELQQKKEKTIISPYPEPSYNFCIGTRKSSPSWVQLPPLVNEYISKALSHGNSVNVNESIVLLGHKALRVEMTKSQVTVGKYNVVDTVAPCSVYDDQNDRIISVHYGTVEALDGSLQFPSKILSRNFTRKYGHGCGIVHLEGKRSLFVAGGFENDENIYSVPSRTVEYIPLENINDGMPRKLSPTKLTHAIWPAITQVGSEIFVVGGLQKFEEGGEKFIEKWDGEAWQVVDINAASLDQQTNTRNVFLPKSFCKN